MNLDDYSIANKEGQCNPFALQSVIPAWQVYSLSLGSMIQPMAVDLADRLHWASKLHCQSNS